MRERESASDTYTLTKKAVRADGEQSQIAIDSIKSPTTNKQFVRTSGFSSPRFAQKGRSMRFAQSESI